MITYPSKNGTSTSLINATQMSFQNIYSFIQVDSYHSLSSQETVEGLLTAFEVFECQVNRLSGIVSHHEGQHDKMVEVQDIENGGRSPDDVVRSTDNNNMQFHSLEEGGIFLHTELAHLEVS